MKGEKKMGMLLSTQTGGLDGIFGEVEAIRMIGKAGFDCADYSAFLLTRTEDHPALGSGYKQYAKTLLDAAREAGITFNQSHAPYPSSREGDEEYNAKIEDILKRSIEFASILGAKVICIHPVKTLSETDEKQHEDNLAFYRRLEPCARDFGIKIGIENMFFTDEKSKCKRPSVCGTSERMNRLFDELSSDAFTCLIDVGHCGLAGEEPDVFIRRVGGKRLGALHIQDNNYRTDDHTIPFMRSIDWAAVTKALHDVGYAGDFTFEANAYVHHMPKEMVADTLAYLGKVGRFLISQIENPQE